ncbi:hypothetical protein KBC03_03520 [Patescibacteria group bacterium]|nr:hypothetical protein [Patescibacteria group bacterium]
MGNNDKNNTSSTSTLSAEAQTLVRALDETLSIKLNKAAVSLDEKNDLTLSLSSNFDMGNFTVRITGTGENCPVVG